MHDLLRTLIKQFMPYAKEKIGFEHPPKLFLRQDAKNAADPLGKTAFYDPQAKSVTIYTSNRHPKDIMRSLSHELVHHKQNCNGQFEDMGEMGEGYAQNNNYMRGMEREAYEVGNLCFRDWEDSIKGTIYNEHLLKGVNNTMSTKSWKNKELTTLLSEAWGFGFNLDNLNEGELKGGLKDYMEKKRGKSSDDDDDGDDDEEESVEEGFERPKSATGAGPTNKGGKIDRSDVANKDTSKFGQGASKGGGKESAGGSVAAPKAGKIDRSDVANKASGRWLKESEEEEETLEEMCPAEDHDMEGMEMEAGPENRAVELLDELKELIMQLQGQGAEMVPGNRPYQEGQEEEELEERRGRGRKGPHIRGNPDPRLREEKIRQLLRQSLKKIKERRNK